MKKGVVGVCGIGTAAFAFNLFGLGEEEEEDSKLEAVPIKERKVELWKWSKEVKYYSKLDRGKVRCKQCPHRCLLKPNYRGACRTRINKEGVLYTKAYGNPCTVYIDPVEKKPFFHFLPGTKTFSLSTAGCNLRCHYCQNWEISQVKPEETRNYDLMPKSLIEVVAQKRTKDKLITSIAYTYAEPVAFYEYMLDSALLAREKGLKNVVVTNGYLEQRPLKELCQAVDAIKIDLKGFDEDFYRQICSAELEYVRNSCETVAASGVHFELVNLIVPTLNDDLGQIRQMCKWIGNLSKDIPLHFSRFYPHYKLKNLPPTPMKSLLAAWNIAKEEGLNYSYIGNVPHGEWGNTYCPSCKELIIERIGYTVQKMEVDRDGKCKKCSHKIYGVWS